MTEQPLQKILDKLDAIIKRIDDLLERFASGDRK